MCSSAARPFLTQQGNTSPLVRSVRRPSTDSFSYRPGRQNSNQSGEHSFAASGATRISQSMRVTRILVLVSTCFLVLNAPAHSCVIAMKIYTEMGIDRPTEYIQLDSFHQQKNLSNVQMTSDSSNQTEPVMVLGTNKLEDSVGVHIFYIAVVLTQMIAYASYSVNFFLYSFSGITFRTSLRQILRKFRKG